MKHLLKLLSVLLAFTLVVAACGSDDTEDSAPEDTAAASDDSDTSDADDDSADAADDAEDAGDDSDATTEDEDPDADADADAEDASTAATGEPIYVGYIGSIVPGSNSFDTRTNGINSVLTPFNAAGGIDGRPVELLTCDDTGDPNVGAECVDSLIGEGVVTFVGSLNQSGASANPIIAEEGFATIGGFMLTAGDNGDPLFYTSDGGNIVGGPGNFSACAALGAERVSIAYVDIPAAAIIPGLIDSLVASAWPDTEVIGADPMAIDLVDLAPIAAKIIGDEPDCVVSLSTEGQNVALITALRDQGYDGRVALNAASYTTEKALEEFGDGANGFILSQYYDQASAGWAEYEADLAAYAPDATPDGWGLGGWLAAKIALDVIAAAGPDPAAITAAIPEVVVDYDTNGLTEAPLDWSVPGDNPLGVVNLRNEGWIPVEIIDGEEVADPNGYVSVFVSAG